MGPTRQITSVNDTRRETVVVAAGELVLNSRRRSY